MPPIEESEHTLSLVPDEHAAVGTLELGDVLSHRGTGEVRYARNITRMCGQAPRPKWLIGIGIETEPVVDDAGIRL